MSKQNQPKPEKKSNPGKPSSGKSGEASPKVLNLIDEKPKPAPKRASLKGGEIFAPLGKAAAEEAKRVKSKGKEKASEPKQTLDDQKKNALSIFDKEEQKEKERAARKRRRSEQSSQPINPLGAALTSLIPGPPKPVKAEQVEDDPKFAPDATVEVDENSETGEVQEVDPQKIISIKPPIIVKELAEKMGLKTFEIIRDLIPLKIFVTPDKSIEPDVVAKICERHGFVFERERRERGAGVHKVEEVIVEPPPQPVAETPKEELKTRAPIVTVMGHVDHGKTSLLDAIRKTRVTKSESGGITQHIRAYSVDVKGKPVTFIDTPGHAAFSAMRARGANVTDIVVLVVAANDGFMPQTIEALNHAKAAGVTIIVAINKVDLPSANVDRVRTQMQENGLMPVEWGGDVESVEISALKGVGIDTLLELLSLQSEVLELTANPKAPARAMIIESNMEPGRGHTATAIVRDGTLKVGAPFICGAQAGKVKALFDDNSKAIKSVAPGMPVQVVGFTGFPNIGDELVVMESEKDAKILAEERQESRRKQKLSAPRRANLSTLFKDLEEDKKKALKLVLKTDVQGSAQAIVSELEGIQSNKINLEILHAAPGPITESDVLLASASNAIVVGFNTKVESKAVAVSKREGVNVKLYSIIYELFDQIKEAMLGMLDVETREKVIGHAKVKQVFKVTRGRVAGCFVTDGRIDRKARARVLRNKIPVYDGSVETLRRFKDEVNEVKDSTECGIRLGNFNDYEEGDVIECYILEKLEQKL